MRNSAVGKGVRGDSKKLFQSEVAAGEWAFIGNQNLPDFTTVLFAGSKESTSAATKMPRRRGPLHTCGASISAIASKAYTKTRDCNGPIGPMTKRMTKLATFTFPLIHALQCQWLALLSFVDDHILGVEKLIEKLFPPSTKLFDKLDEFLQIVETLPGKFDETVSKFPDFVHQVPFLDFALTFLISWLRFLVLKLTHWGSNNTKEREIRVDINCNHLNVEGESADQVHLNIELPSHICISASSINEPEMVRQEHGPLDYLMDTQGENVERFSVSNSAENETNMFTKSFKSVVMECSYEEMLEKGEKESTENAYGSFKGDSPKANATEEEVIESCQKDENKSTEKEHPILELFEASWHMKPRKVGK